MATRIIFFVLTGLFLFLTFPYISLASQATVIFRPGSDTYTAGGQSYQMDQEALLINERLYVPLRYFALGIGADKRCMVWNKDASKVGLIIENDLFILDIQKGEVNINGRRLKMELRPVEINGRIYVPLRYFSEIMDYVVFWDEQTMDVCVYPGKLSEKDRWKGKLRHELVVDAFRFKPGDINLDQWVIILLENNIHLTIQSIERIIGQLSNPGETLLYYEKRIGDALIDLPDDPGQTANNQNAITALNYLNELEVKKGDIFSFNGAAGPYSGERGYIVGFSFSGDKVIKEMGGGVCRTSTLLYNAVLNAGLPVIERHRHSLPVYYVPQNKDATVGYGVLDFRFKNDREYPLVIKTAANSSRIYLSIWERHD